MAVVTRPSPSKVVVPRPPPGTSATVTTLRPSAAMSPIQQALQNARQSMSPVGLPGYSPAPAPPPANVFNPFGANGFSVVGSSFGSSPFSSPLTPSPVPSVTPPSYADGGGGGGGGGSSSYPSADTSADTSSASPADTSSPSAADTPPPPSAMVPFTPTSSASLAVPGKPLIPRWAFYAAGAGALLLLAYFVFRTKKRKDNPSKENYRRGRRYNRFHKKD